MSLTPEESFPSKPEPEPLGNAKARGFRIGGKTRQITAESSPPLDQPVTEDLPTKEPPSQVNNDADTTPKKARRTFRIGGKGKGGTSSNSQIPEAAQSVVDRTRATQSPSVQPPSSPPVIRSVRERSPVVEEHEETAEEKAERRRAELKRKTEEAAKKQAVSKKKRRF
jgi:hypothetical protein